ncbi:MAG: glycoside hydrolase family 25 protein [Eggerthellaceae bacterium]|nr:glycoside hydrolase family 25 protein [Eggerthellaceae bacterium]
MFSVLVLFLLASIGIQAFIHFTSGEEEAQPFFSHANFTRYEQFYFYTEGDILIEKTGVDVSDHQGQIDWDRVAKNHINFAFIRAGYRGSTEGDLFEDEYFSYNLKNAQAAGIECGIYFFSQALNEQEAREEAEFVLELLDGAKLEYPVVFDFEIAAMGITSRVADLTNEEASAIAQTFCESIEAAGYKAMLYGNGYDLARYSEDLLERYPIWYAEYGALPAYTSEYSIWQYGNEGHIDGIETIVDLNLDLSQMLEE